MQTVLSDKFQLEPTFCLGNQDLILPKAFCLITSMLKVVFECIKFHSKKYKFLERCNILHKTIIAVIFKSHRDSNS